MIDKQYFNPSLQSVSLLICLALFGISCGHDANDKNGDSPEPIVKQLALGVDYQIYVREIEPRFLSFALDASQIVGGHWWSPEGGSDGIVSDTTTKPFDFSRPRLLNLTRELAPAYLRIGGSEADKLYYDMSDDPPAEPPADFDFVFTKNMWDRINQFAVAAGLEVMFTLNAGPGPRDDEKNWHPDNARILLEYTVSRQYAAPIWELGNEVNGFPLVFGLRHYISGKQFAKDMENLKALRDEIDPTAKIAGPASAIWPLVGEMSPILPRFLRAGGHLPDLVTWHFYPQQSHRCPVATRPASPWNNLTVPYLNEVNNWSEQIAALTAQYAPQAKVVLGETGNAQCGGAPGISDRFVAGFWWLDQLGLMARAGQQFMVRQTLSGSEYGLINDETLEPNPDYWNSVLWKRLMGERVLAATLPSYEQQGRAYAHCTPGRPGAVTLLLLNLDTIDSLEYQLPDFVDQPVEVYLVTTDDLLGANVRLNGQTLTANDDGTLPEIAPETIRATGSFVLPATSYAFLVYPEMNAAACR